MNRKLLALLALIAAPLLWMAADFTVNNLRLQSNANGASTNDWYAVRTYGGKNVSLTNGQLTLQTNSQMTAGGGTNDNRGVASALIGGASTNVWNTLTAPRSVMVVDSTATANGKATNRITATGSANVLISNSDVGGQTNTAEIIDTSAANLVVSSWTSGRGSGPSRVRVQDGIGGVYALNTLARGEFTSEGAIASIMAAKQDAGTNRSIAPEAVILAQSAVNNATNYSEFIRGIAVMHAEDGSRNFLSGQGSVVAMNGDGGTNIFDTMYGAVGAGYNESGGLISVGGTGLYIVSALNNQRATAPGFVYGRMLVTIADSLYGSASVVDTGGTLIGSGTNSLPYTTQIGYGGAWFRVETNGPHSIHHTEAADATVNWNMSTNAYLGVVTLPAGSQSVFITNAIVTALSCVTATINSDDTTAITVKAIPTAGQLQLKAVAAATADTRISWAVHSP